MNAPPNVIPDDGGDAGPDALPPLPPPAIIDRPVPAPDGAGRIPPDDRMLAMFMHASAITGYFIPLANVLIPLIIWLGKRDLSPSLDKVGREVLNFNISMILWFIAATILMIVLIGFVAFIALWVFGLIVTIIATLDANKGYFYRYPLTIRFL